MSDGSDGEETTSKEKSGAIDNSSCSELIGPLRTDMQTIIRRIKALEPDLFSHGH